MANLIVINGNNSWSAGAWFFRFALRTIHGFLPQFDAEHIARDFEQFYSERHVDFSIFESKDLIIIYYAARHAQSHLSRFGLSSAVFQDNAFTSDEKFFRRFSEKLDELIVAIGQDDRVKDYV